MRGLPKEKLKGRVIQQLCMEHSLCKTCGKKECDGLAEAVNAGDEKKCRGLGESSKLCTVLASRDPAKCSGFLPKGDSRSFCEALATDDANRCPADSADCKSLVNGFAAFRKEGRAGAEEIYPGIAAASSGRDACKPILTKSEKSCEEKK